MKLFFLIQFLIVISGEKVKASNCIKMQPTTDTVYIYYDANRNRYELKANELEYVPVNAKESSSGIYSGGTYESVVLKDGDRKKLVSLFKAAKANKKAHTDKNIKPNTAIEIRVDNKKESFLLKAKSAINLSMNNYLKQLIKK